MILKHHSSSPSHRRRTALPARGHGVNSSICGLPHRRAKSPLAGSGCKRPTIPPGCWCKLPFEIVSPGKAGGDTRAYSRLRRAGRRPAFRITPRRGRWRGHTAEFAARSPLPQVERFGARTPGSLHCDAPKRRGGRSV